MTTPSSNNVERKITTGIIGVRFGPGSRTQAATRHPGPFPLSRGAPPTRALPELLAEVLVQRLGHFGPRRLGEVGSSSLLAFAIYCSFASATSALATNASSASFARARSPFPTLTAGSDGGGLLGVHGLALRVTCRPNRRVRPRLRAPARAPRRGGQGAASCSRESPRRRS